MSCAVTHNTRLNGVEIRFAGRPDDAVLEQVKAKGFRWSRTNQNWYKAYSESLMQWAIDFCGNPANEAEVVMPTGRVRLITNASLTSGGKVPINVLKSEIEAGKLEYARSERMRMDDSYETIPVADRTYKKADLNSDDYLMKDLRNNPKSFNDHWTNSISLNDNGTINVRGYEFRYLPDVEGAEYNAREAREATQQKAAAAGSVAFEYLAGNLFVPINRKPQNGPFTIPEDQLFDKEETEAVGTYPAMGSYHGYPVAGTILVREEVSTITSWTFGSQQRETKQETYRRVDFFVGDSTNYNNRLWVQQMRLAQPGDAEIPFQTTAFAPKHPYDAWEGILKAVGSYQATLASADRAKKADNKAAQRRQAEKIAGEVAARKRKWLAFEETSPANRDLCRAITGETIEEQEYRMLLWQEAKTYQQETLQKVLETEVRKASRTRQPQPIATWEAWKRGEKVAVSAPVVKAAPAYELVPFEELKEGDVIVNDKRALSTSMPDKSYFYITKIIEDWGGNKIEGIYVTNFGWEGTRRMIGKMYAATNEVENKRAYSEGHTRQYWSIDNKLPANQQRFKKVPVADMIAYIKGLYFNEDRGYLFADNKNPDQLREIYRDNPAVVAVYEQVALNAKTTVPFQVGKETAYFAELDKLRAAGETATAPAPAESPVSAQKPGLSTEEAALYAEHGTLEATAENMRMQQRNDPARYNTPQYRQLIDSLQKVKRKIHALEIEREAAKTEPVKPVAVADAVAPIDPRKFGEKYQYLFPIWWKLVHTFRPKNDRPSQDVANEKIRTYNGMLDAISKSIEERGEDSLIPIQRFEGFMAGLFADHLAHLRGHDGSSRNRLVSSANVALRERDNEWINAAFTEIETGYGITYPPFPFAVPDLVSAVGTESAPAESPVSPDPMRKTYLIWGTKKGDPDWKEVLVAEGEAAPNMEKVKAWGEANGYDRLRTSVFDGEKPDFVGAVSTKALDKAPDSPPIAPTAAQLTARLNIVSLALELEDDPAAVKQLTARKNILELAIELA